MGWWVACWIRWDWRTFWTIFAYFKALYLPHVTLFLYWRWAPCVRMAGSAWMDFGILALCTHSFLKLIITHFCYNLHEHLINDIGRVKTSCGLIALDISLVRWWASQHKEWSFGRWTVYESWMCWKKTAWENACLNQDIDNYISGLDRFLTENHEMIFWRMTQMFRKQC